MIDFTGNGGMPLVNEFGVIKPSYLPFFSIPFILVITGLLLLYAPEKNRSIIMMIGTVVSLAIGYLFGSWVSVYESFLMIPSFTLGDSEGTLHPTSLYWIVTIGFWVLGAMLLYAVPKLPPQARTIAFIIVLTVIFSSLKACTYFIENVE